MVSCISGVTLDKAMKELGEVPDQRMAKIEELRTKLKEWIPDPNDPNEKELSLHRIEDDKFLLRFLRARKFDVERAKQLFVNYYKYRAKHSLWLGELTPDSVKDILRTNLVSIMPHRAQGGSKVLVARLGMLDFEVTPAKDILKMLLVILDELIEDEETQVHGISFCEDLAESTFLKMMSLMQQEQFAKGLMFELIQDAFPARFKGFHILNQPWYISILMSIARPFMKQKTKDRIHMHGADYESLHNFLIPEHLPADFGGELESLDVYSAYNLFYH